MAAANEAFREAALRLGRDHGHQFDRRVPRRIDPLPGQRAELPARNTGSARFLTMATGIILLLAAVIAGVALSVSDWFAANETTADTSQYEIVIGDDVLYVPANAIRFRAQRASSAQNRIDLHLRWPELDGYTAEADTEFRGDRANPNLILLTLASRAMRLDMSGRVEPIYARFFDGQPLPAGNGLVRQALAASSGFVDEDLYYEKDSPYPYAARCIRPGLAMSEPYCLRDIHLGRGLSVTYRFHISLIADWMAIEAAVRARLHGFLRD
jgi:hypothetical protein